MENIAQNSTAIKIAPSLLSADFSKLASEIAEVEKGGADWLHVDVMDGHFVPNLTIGPLVVKAIKPHTKLFIDAHLMVTDPDSMLEAFAKAGVDLITVHVETTRHLSRTLVRIRELGMKAGVTLNPSTPLVLLEESLDLVDLVLVMSVNPGFGGQKFIESSIDKIERLTQMRGHRHFLIEVDGGVCAENAAALKAAGADVLVAGSAIFSESDRALAIQKLRNA